MLHATIFVPCAQWIVASCFLLRSSPALLLLSDMHTDEYVMQETTCRSMLHASSNLVHTDVRPRCRADDRPRYNNTAATPAALPQRVLDSRVCFGSALPHAEPSRETTP